MIPDDEPTVQPPDSRKVFDDVEKEKTVKIRPPPSTHPTTFLHPTKTPRYSIQTKTKNNVQKLRS